MKTLVYKLLFLLFVIGIFSCDDKRTVEIAHLEFTNESGQNVSLYLENKFGDITKKGEVVDSLMNMQNGQISSLKVSTYIGFLNSFNTFRLVFADKKNIIYQKIATESMFKFKANLYDKMEHIDGENTYRIKITHENYEDALLFEEGLKKLEENPE